ncbi:MAG: helix-turn-helix transcriptional regulator [Betaproteobacteria bacterium]|nr:helix-turn-helix transcriptional regulator [Betaproteobacteria bacterium]
MRVRLLRAARGWSQEMLAEQSGLHRNYVGHIERAELNAGIDNLEKIARAFGITLCALLAPDAARR